MRYFRYVMKLGLCQVKWTGREDRHLGAGGELYGLIVLISTSGSSILPKVTVEPLL